MSQIGRVVEGTITGIQPYGAFVAFDDGMTGLIHISEISDGYVKDINRFVSVNEKVTVKIVDYDNATKQARLSLKALQQPSYRKMKHKKRQAQLPKMELGFKSIEEKLDYWVSTTLKERRKDD